MGKVLRPRANIEAGHSWVDRNHDLKEELKRANGGVMPTTPAFTTSTFAGSGGWSEGSLPEILFYLQPPKPGYPKSQPLLKKSNEKEIRDLPVLLDRISVDVPGWMMVAWRRLDPRIIMQDLVDRMTTDLGAAKTWTQKEVHVPSKNILQNHCTRNCRKLLGHYTHYGRRDVPHRTEVQAMEGLSSENIEDNTTLKRHPIFSDRLVKIKLGRRNNDGNIVVQQMDVTQNNLEQTTYPCGHFRNAVSEYTPEIGLDMWKSIMLLFKLQERAVKHGITKNKTEPNTTFDGGCGTCTWHGPGEDGFDESDLADLQDVVRTETIEDGTEDEGGYVRLERDVEQERDEDTVPELPELPGNELDFDDEMDFLKSLEYEGLGLATSPGEEDEDVIFAQWVEGWREEE